MRNPQDAELMARAKRQRVKRVRVEKGLYIDQYGYSAIVSVGRYQKEKRFSVTTPKSEMRSWRRQARAELDGDLQALGLDASKGSLEQDVRTYLTKRHGRPGFAADRSHLRAWLKLYAERSRRSLGAPDIEAALTSWRQSNVAPQTVKHRCRALRELFVALDGPDAKHPLRGISLPKIARVAPTPVSAAVIRTVARRMKALDAKAYARFLLRATTGQRPDQIMRAQPDDLDLKRGIWFVRPAKGGDPVPLPLNQAMVKAWLAFVAAKAWGTFDTSRHAKQLRACGWPIGVRPYNLRHTFAIDLLLSGADLGDVQGLLGHADIHTTRKFYAPILIARLKQTVQKRRLKL
jgi:integrase